VQITTRMTALSAYRAGKPSLPPGYGLEHGANVLLLRRRDGSVVATFSARDVAPAKVAQTAEADRRARDPENS
jgi:hypothetical protein